MTADPVTGACAAHSDYAVRLGRHHVLLGSPQALLDVLRSLELSVSASRRHGLPAPARVLRLIRLLGDELSEHRSRTSGSGSAEVPLARDVSASVLPDHPVGAAEAAHLLGVTPRQIRYLGEQLEGRKVGRLWTFDRETLAGEAQRRQQERNAS